MTEKIRCEATIRGKDRWDAFHPQKCSRTACFNRDGKWYCTIHDPEYKAEKDKQRQAAWDAKFANQRRHYDRDLLISRAFGELSLEQIEERNAAGQCPCCGTPKVAPLPPTPGG